MSIAEWVRQALDLARRREPTTDVEKKLAVVRAAVQHSSPTADVAFLIDQPTERLAPTQRVIVRVIIRV